MGRGGGRERGGARGEHKKEGMVGCLSQAHTRTAATRFSRPLSLSPFIVSYLGVDLVDGDANVLVHPQEVEGKLGGAGGLGKRRGGGEGEG
jgi:hypothetical protein